MATLSQFERLIRRLGALTSGRSRTRSTVIGLLIAVAAVAVAIYVRLVPLAGLGSLLAYITLYPAVTVSSAIGGYRAGLAATVLSAVAITVLLAPIESYDGWLGMTVFLVGCLLIVAVSETMHYAQGKAKDAEAEARLASERAEIEQRSHWALKGAGGGAWDWDLKKGEAWWSPEMCEISGIEPGTSMRLENSLAIIHEDDRESVKNALEAALAERRFYEFQYRIRHPQKGVRHMASQGRLALDEDGRPAHLVGLTFDITERKRAEAAIAESEARYKAVVDVAMGGIITINEEGIIQSLNPAAIRLFGYSQEETLGRKVNMLMPEPHASRHDEYVQAYLSTGEARIIGIGREVEGRRKDGSLFPAELTVSEARLKGERIFIGVVHDISESKEAAERQRILTDVLRTSELEARRQQALFQSVFDSAPEAILVCGLDYRALMINPAFRRLFGYQDEECAGLEQMNIFSDESEWDRIRKIQFGTGETAEMEPAPARFRRKNGDTFPGEITTSIYRDQNDAPQGHVSVIRDLSLEHQREEQQQRSQKLEVVGQLTGGVAHDFNNLLTVIIGNLELLEMQLNDERLKVMLNKALDAADMGQRLTDSLLTFSRRQTLTPERINLNEVVLSLTDLLQRTLGSEIEMTTSLSPHLRPVVADRGRIESAILNLALNARDAMAKGGKLILETRNVDLGEHSSLDDTAPKPGPYVRLSVRDTGEGMTPEVKARAFDPFFTTKPKGRGTGLGLSTIYGFARQSGGHAAIESELGKGTTVRIELPAELNMPPPLESAEEAARSAASMDPPSTGRILVVEDNERVRDLTVARIRNLGYEVLEAGDGPHALEILESGTPVDLIFIDLIMPGGISGLDLCDMVRERWPRIRPLLTSGYAEELTSSDHLERIRVQLLRKPYRQAELAKAIESTLATA